MSRKGSWDDDGSSLSESLLRFVHGGDEANPPTPRSVTQALALTPATKLGIKLVLLGSTPSRTQITS